jgi:hypothetical protein
MWGLESGFLSVTKSKMDPLHFQMKWKRAN